MQGLAAGKVSYATYWFNKENLNISVSISKFKMIKIDYENAELMDINTKEKTEIANKVFLY